MLDVPTGELREEAGTELLRLVMRRPVSGHAA